MFDVKSQNASHKKENIVSKWVLLAILQPFIQFLFLVIPFPKHPASKAPL